MQLVCCAHRLAKGEKAVCSHAGIEKPGGKDPAVESRETRPMAGLEESIMDGQRAAKIPDGSKKGLVIAGIVIGVLAAAYLGLCAWVGMSDKIMPNVTIAGLDVSGITAEQAQNLVDEAVHQYSSRATVTLTYRDWSGDLKGSDYQITGNCAGEAAWNVGREHFLTRGFAYMRHLLGGSTQVGRENWNVTVDAAQPALDAMLDEAERQVGGGVVQMSYEVDGENLVVTKGITGAAFDRERVDFIVGSAVLEALETAIVQQGDSDAAMDLAAQEAVVETAPDEPDFDAIHQELYAEAKSAEMDPETYTITDHVVGVDFDEDALKTAYEQAGEGETITFPLTITQPKETRQSLEAKLFADLLGQATSNVGGSANRKHNVKLSAEACNGVILLPGEEFSYNNTTGSRSADKGYLAAPVYIGGKSEDEVGGGICQTSSTIYYAVLHTTLEVVERVNHRYAVGYVPDGMDATVYYGSTDFRFKNNTDYPVKIVTESYDKGGVRKLTVKIYGTNADGRYAVPERTQYDWVQPTTSYVADETVPRGTLVLDTKQNAYTGRTAQTYRHVYEADGTFVETQNMGVSKYKMRPNLYHYNPLDGDPATWVDGKPPAPKTPVDPGTVTPVVPEAPETPETPGTPEVPETPKIPETPETPVIPETPTDPASSVSGTGEPAAQPQPDVSAAPAPGAPADAAQSDRPGVEG